MFDLARVDIEERPAVVEEQSRIKRLGKVGHDNRCTIIRGRLVSMVDRASGIDAYTRA